MITSQEKVNKMRRLLGLLFGLTLFTGILIIPGYCLAKNDYWPGSDWRTSTPEEQGIDSTKLLKMVNDIKNNDIDIRSLLIIRHGYLVAECYRDPYNKDTAHDLKSVNKSFISALTGIALREKYLKSLDQKVSDFFPEYFNDKMDPRKKTITLRHLLTMTAGLATTDNDTSRWSHSQDWVQYVMDQPMVHDPGTTFDYSTGLPHTMCAIITKTSGMSTLEFGRKYLFDPLGIAVTKWTRDPQGIVGPELYLTPRDMAKFGYLYLHNGNWNGRQIIPEQWVQESTKNQVPSGTKYGYWWWPDADDYQARGWGGQYIIVNPKLDMVVVFTAADFFKPLQYLQTYIYPAVNGETLKPNPAACREMRATCTALAVPKLDRLPLLPESAAKIDGKVFHCKPNSFGLTSFSITFHGPDCILTVNPGKDAAKIPVSLDGTYRLIPMENKTTYFGERPIFPMNDPGDDQYQVAFKGKWLDDQRFVIEWTNYLGEPVKFSAQITLNGSKALIMVSSSPAPWGRTVFIDAGL
jgi:CubicO group peptidase (beta-lactamase class C family)